MTSYGGKLGSFGEPPRYGGGGEWGPPEMGGSLGTMIIMHLN